MNGPSSNFRSLFSNRWTQFEWTSLQNGLCRTSSRFPCPDEIMKTLLNISIIPLVAKPTLIMGIDTSYGALSTLFWRLCVPLQDIEDCYILSVIAVRRVYGENVGMVRRKENQTAGGNVTKKWCEMATKIPNFELTPKRESNGHNMHAAGWLNDGQLKLTRISQTTNFTSSIKTVLFSFHYFTTVL